MTRSRAWLLPVTCAAALAACTQDTSAPALGRVQQEAVAVRVDGLLPDLPHPHLGWVDTLLDLEAGDHLTVHCVGGLIAPWGIDPVFDCNGAVLSPPWSESIAPQCSFGSLVGKIGVHGTPFCLGSAHARSMIEDGRLYLGFNDGVSFEDNVGSWSVHVEIDRPTPDWIATIYQGCPAWQWSQDEDLLVVLPDPGCRDAAGLAPGLYFVRGTDVHAIDVDGVSFSPILSVEPSEGAQTLISDIGSLTLQTHSLINDHCLSEYEGNSNPIIEVSPRLLTDGSIEITTTIEGMTYVALPPGGTLQIVAGEEVVDNEEPACGSTSAPQTFTITAGSFASNGSKTWYCGMSSFTALGTPLGNLQFSVLSPGELPAVHFEPGGGTPGQWIELDVDHSCVATPELRLITRVPQ